MSGRSWLLVGAVVAAAVADALVIWLKRLPIDTGVNLVAASFVAVSAIAAAVATATTLELSRRSEETARHATEALSLALLPDSINVIVYSRDGRAICQPAPNGRPMILIDAYRYPAEGDPVRAIKKIDDPLWLGFDGCPTNTTYGELAQWMKKMVIIFSDERRLTEWQITIDRPLLPRVDPLDPNIPVVGDVGGEEHIAPRSWYHPYL